MLEELSEAIERFTPMASQSTPAQDIPAFRIFAYAEC